MLRSDRQRPSSSAENTGLRCTICAGLRD